MVSHNVIADVSRWRRRSPGGGPAARPDLRQAALHQEVYARDVTDRESVYGDSFRCEWCRQSNLSADDFE